MPWSLIRQFLLNQQLAHPTRLIDVAIDRRSLPFGSFILMLKMSTALSASTGKLVAYRDGHPAALRGSFAARGACFALVILLCIASWPVTGKEQRRRIYFLESLTPTQFAAVRTIEAFQKRLAEKTSERFEIFIDYMELGRFPGDAHIDRTVRFLAGKYSEAPPDVLIPLGRAAVPFMVKYRDALAPAAPVIIASVPVRAAAEAKSLAKTVSVVTEYNVLKTLELAQRLQPEARNLAFVAGASDYDRSWVDDARRELAPYQDRYNTRYIVGLPYDEMLKEVAQLPRDTIAIASFVFVDGTGLPRVPPDVAAAIAAVSPAPVYSSISSFFGRGIVGGYIDSFESHGVAAADLAFEILSGKDAATLSTQTKPLHRYEVDARALDRWGLSTRNLPPDTAIRFEEPTIWQQHRGTALAVMSVLALQTAFLGFLLIQRRRRQRAELELKESEERMAFAAASANIGLWQFDRATDELWTTEHCRAMFGLTGGAPLTRQSFLAAVHPDDRELAISSLREAFHVGRFADTDVRIVLPGGQVRWISARARSHPRHHQPSTQISGIFVDITEQKAAESEATLQRQEIAHLMRVSVLGELSGSIAHEINQPLTAILSNAQAALHLLEQKSPDFTEVRDALNDIVQEDNRAGEVIGRLRNLLKKGERKLEPVNLNDLVNSTIGLLKSELISRGIKAELDLAHALPVTSGDPIQLQQVLLNLVMNAMDAMTSTPIGQRLIVVTSYATQTGTAEIVLTDHGTGIDPRDRDRLFQPFYTTKDHGLGLGLAICSTIVQAHGGNLTLTNGDGGGAIAKLSLPAQRILVAAQ